MDVPPVQIQFIDPVRQALTQVRRVLFEPFQLGNWFVLGFCAWLAYLGQFTGFGGGFPGNGGGKNGMNLPVKSPADFVEPARSFLESNWVWLIPVLTAVVVFAVGLWLFVLWISSRGQFMFLDCVIRNRAAVVVPWKTQARSGWSLFQFRLLTVLASGIFFGAVALVVFLGFTGLANAPELKWVGIAALIVAAIGAIALILLAVAAAVLMDDFVLPLMWLRQQGCLAAWREFLGLLGSRMGAFILYLLLRLGLGILTGILVLAVILGTCCIAGCLMALPYLGTVLILPILVFSRALPLYFLAQFGRDYDVFLPTHPPA